MDDLIQQALSDRPGVLLVLSAASGVGKTTLAGMLSKALGKRALFSISYTTRAPRGQEKDGVDYHFVNEENFKKMIAAGEFLEWACVHGNYYGTHREYASAAKKYSVVMFDIDVQGGAQIKNKHPEAVTVFILPPSMEELERRLRARGTDSEEVITKRMKTAQFEIEIGTQSYDYVIVNGDLERAYRDLTSIVRAALCRGKKNFL